MAEFFEAALPWVAAGIAFAVILTYANLDRKTNTR